MRKGPAGTVTQSSAIASGRSAGSPAGSRPPSSIAWRIVSVCWSSWRRTIVHDGVRSAAVHRLDRTVADGGEIGVRAGRVEDLDLAAHRARRLEGVVAGGEIRAQQRLA